MCFLFFFSDDDCWFERSTHDLIIWRHLQDWDYENSFQRFIHEWSKSCDDLPTRSDFAKKLEKVMVGIANILPSPYWKLTRIYYWIQLIQCSSRLWYDNPHFDAGESLLRQISVVAYFMPPTDGCHRPAEAAGASRIIKHLRMHGFLPIVPW